jgi:hypothetical protein
MTDLGKGDVVAAVHDVSVAGVWTGHGDYNIKAGQRAIVEEVRQCLGTCTGCSHKPAVIGIRLVEYPLERWVLWCPCEWRRIGGSEADHVARFAGYLKPKPVLAQAALKRLFERAVQTERTETGERADGNERTDGSGASRRGVSEPRQESEPIAESEPKQQSEPRRQSEPG